MFLQRETEVLGTGVVFAIQVFVHFCGILVLSVLSGHILRLASLVAVKSMPSFQTAFKVSFFSWILFFLSAYLIPVNALPLINSVPLVIFFISNWIFSLKYLVDAKESFIGFGKGFIVALQVTAFAVIISFLGGILIVWSFKS